MSDSADIRNRSDWPVGWEVEIHDGPDSVGRYSYTLRWPCEYLPGHPDGEFGRHMRGQCFRAHLPLWATRPVHARDVSFAEWLAGRGVDVSTLPSDAEEATHIGQSVFVRQRTRREARQHEALARRIRQKHALWTHYLSAVPARVIGRRPLDLSRADDRAYVRVQQRRAERRGEGTCTTAR